MRKTLGAVLLLTIVGVAAYCNTFHVPFQFDDSAQIVDNPVIRDLHNFFSSMAGYNFNPRRFIGYVTFALNYHFGGLHVAGYHIVNLAIHIINGFLVYSLVLLTFRTPYFRAMGNKQKAIGDRQEAIGEGLSAIGAQHSALDPQDHNSPAPADPPEASDLRVLIALFSALLFVAHPVQTMAVTYIVQRLTSLAAMFYLLSVVFYIRGRLASPQAGKLTSTESERPGGWQAGKLASYVFSLVFAVCAMKTKEIAFTLPVVIVLYEFSFFRSALRKKLLFLLPVLLTLAIIPLSIMGTHRPLGEILSDLSEKTRVQTNVPRWDYLMTQLRAITTYIRLLFFPANQNLDYDYPIYHSLFTPQVFLSFLFLTAIFGMGVYLFYKSWQAGKLASLQADKGQKVTDKDSGFSYPVQDSDLSPLAISLSPYYRVIAFGILWFFITLSVESSFIPIADVIFEHRVYLPSVGAFMAIVTSIFVAVERLKGRRKGVQRAVVAALALVVVVLAGATYARNRVWQDEARLWEDVVSKSPQKSRGHNDLGYIYLGRGMTDMAVRQFKIALRLDPRNADAYNNLGVAYYDKGWFDPAITQFLTGLSLASSGPDLADSHHNLGIVYARKGLLSEALAEMKSALTYSPASPEIYSDMGVVYKEMGSPDMALQSYRSALAIRSDYAPAHFNLGLIYQERGLQEQAEEHLSKAHNLDPERF